MNACAVGFERGMGARLWDAEEGVMWTPPRARAMLTRG